MHLRITLSGLTPKTTTLAGEAFTVGPAFFTQTFQLRFLLGRKHGFELRSPILHRGAHLLAKCQDAGLIFRAQCALSPFLAELPHLLAKRFVSLALLDDRADLLLLCVAQV